MLTILNFPCLISQKHCELTLTDETIEIKGADIYLEIEITLKAKMRWYITDKGIHSMQVGELTIQAYNDDLDQLKQHLDGRVTYLGIQNYYETMEILSEKNTCKVCLLTDRFTNLQLCCKSIRKDAYEIGQLHQSIMIQYKLQQYREFPKIYEIYESKNHIYIVMEQLDKQINLDLTHEEIQNIVYDLFRIVKILIQNKIDYQLKFSKLMLDVKGNLKLLTCSKACNCKDIEADVYLYNIGKIMIQLYGIDHFNAKQIGDRGNEFIFGLINPNLDYRFSLDDALKHEYITSIMCETNLQMKKFINPKFITQVHKHSNLQSSYYLQNDFK